MSPPVDGHAFGELQSGISAEEKPKADGLLLMDIAIIAELTPTNTFVSISCSLMFLL